MVFKDKNLYFRMMKMIRKLLFPFSLIYGFVVWIRNWLFDIGFLKSYSFDIPIIAVGNLSVGGTGKTPQIEYLIRLLSENYKIAVLSRGYKRQSKGFVLADATATATTIGDEPFQYFQKFKKIQVAVDANRKNGIEQMLALPNAPEIMLLDDAFQHRKVKAGLYILLTTYNDLYCDDCILPAGNLRESKFGAKRADLIIVTKCPKNLSTNEQGLIKDKLKLQLRQSLFFSFIDYDDHAISQNKIVKVEELRAKEKVIVAGIAKPTPFVNFIKNNEDEVLIFPDHHPFTEKDLNEIDRKSENKIIITTEKDYVRLQDTFLTGKLFYLAIKSSFIEKEILFKDKILNFIDKFTS